MTNVEQARAEYFAVQTEWFAADERFHAELVRQFGENAGDKRYDSSQTGWDARTKAAHSALRSEQERYYAALDTYRTRKAQNA